MKKISTLLLLVYSLISCQTNLKNNTGSMLTFCNPMNLSYRFCLDEPSRREAADPSVIRFKDRYYLFASKSGGYWHSTDLTEWLFIETTEIPVEEYAPTAIAIGDTLYFLASSNEKSTIYKSARPLEGKWDTACKELEIPVWDPAFFMDDDKRLYLYWGCSDKNPIYGIELDYHRNFAFIGKPQALISGKPDVHGWEVPGDYNTLINQSPWIEGAWMNKHQGLYYLQYSGPGTEFKSYSDGVYVSDKPLGPFTKQDHNPFASKPEGFAAGAGHGSTFTDKYGNYWHIGTMTISQKHIFERRLGLFPAFFDETGTLHTVTKYGDFPLIMPKKKISGWEEIFPGWMLLSFNKKVEVSSAVDTLPANYLADENIRTFWAAATGDSGEYATIDLGKLCDIYAIQLNFAEYQTKILGREKSVFHRYILEYSEDGKSWQQLADKSESNTDLSHDFIQLSQKVSGRYVRIKNIRVPDGHFALSGFRVFGKAYGEAPGKVSQFTAKRNPNDRRSVKLVWEKAADAIGYTVSFGIHKQKLYRHYQVLGDTSLTINSLDAGQKYYFAIEAFGENGIKPAGLIVEAD
jgi:xylan 1,4-beta-xylosidase